MVSVNPYGFHIESRWNTNLEERSNTWCRGSFRSLVSLFLSRGVSACNTVFVVMMFLRSDTMGSLVLAAYCSLLCVQR